MAKSNFNEDRAPAPPDAVPKSTADLAKYPVIRLRRRIEEMLRSRCGLTADAWTGLGHEAVPILLDIVSADQGPSAQSTRDAALRVVGLFRDKRGDEQIAKIAMDARSRRETRAYALTALADAGSPHARKLAHDMLTMDDALLRGRALDALAKTGTAQDVAELEPVVLRAPNEHHRVKAYDAIAEIEKREGKKLSSVERPVVMGRHTGRLIPILRRASMGEQP